MNEKPNKHLIPEPRLYNEIGSMVARKLKARRNSSSGVWFGLGMMGLIGWSVAVPTLIGAAIGLFLDTKYTGNISWTLTLLIIGLVTGCLNAWHWVAKEENEIRKEQGDHHE
jgi:ATP synthase protein I